MIVEMFHVCISVFVDNGEIKVLQYQTELLGLALYTDMKFSYMFSYM